MPIYEYKCTDCGHELEAMQKMSDAPLVDCPVCAQASLQKQISAAGFRLKGKGWYESDFKPSNKQKNMVKSDESSSSASDSNKKAE